MSEQSVQFKSSRDRRIRPSVHAHRLGGLAEGVLPDDAVTVKQLLGLMPGFAMSVIAKGALLGYSPVVLDHVREIESVGETSDLFFDVHVSRGLSWGDLDVSVEVNEDSIFEGVFFAEEVSEGQCSVVGRCIVTSANATEGSSHFIRVTVSDEDGNGVTRELIINIKESEE